MSLKQYLQLSPSGSSSDRRLPACRYDVALASNTFGTVHVCKFAKQCAHLKLLLHASTAYVAGKQKGRILEKPLQMGQALKKGRCIDIEAELDLANDVKAKLVMARSGTDTSHQQLEKVAMKEIGLKRAKYFGWPNVYAFTKAMGEMLLGTMRGDLPVVIVRPSIVISTFQDPFPGWIEGIRYLYECTLLFASKEIYILYMYTRTG
ncbi:putative fatty acyl-CoA reductase 7 [Dichanthelium oligosanthes]|uniref:Fatty acyl-CoA reductase n=1 Tax=Dichanthelium oligosanthes TaxID=888268 RepID=A0A1E5VQ06_9POAL|nr:putative fatty acyl-CoA reductase 7 [Dichanthelium oligosanthes]